MYKIITILVFISLFSCKKQEKKKLKEENLSILKIEDTVSIKEVKSPEKRVVFNDSVFDTNYIKAKTFDISEEIRVSYNPASANKRIIPKGFLTKFISPHKINVGYPEHLPDDYPESYSFKAFKEYPDFNLFTFTYDDESCCTTLYAATTKKDTIDIINMVVIGYDGGDGGWSGKKYGKWINEYSISNTEASYYEDPFEENQEPKIDTIWSEIALSEKGVFEYVELKKVAYLGGKLVSEE